MDIRNQKRFSKIKEFLYNHSFGYSFLPIYLAVNIVNICNRKCSFCPFHSPYLEQTEHLKWFKAQPNLLDYTSFASFLKRLGVFRRFIKHVAITGKGEPLLHPKFMEFCKILEQYKIPFSITTNGDYLKDFTLLSFKYLTGIRVSLYDTEELAFWTYIHNTYPIITLYNQAGVDIPNIQKGYTTQSKGTEKFCSMPRDFNKIAYCRAPFYFLTINTNESVVPCYSFNEVGKLSDNFWKVWNGKRIRDYRKKALKMKTEHSDCRNCGVKVDL